jgi:hypothetical protein
MDADKQKTSISYHYTFTFPDGRTKEFDVKLDAVTLALIRQKDPLYAQWAKLSYHQCSICPLHVAASEYCPVAVSLEELVEFFKDSISYEEVDVTIRTEARMYTRHVSLQKGVSSLLGIYMVTTGCPVMEKLKPMVRFHLPFASPEETMYRVISMYLFAQYFIYKEGGKPDWDLEDLVKIYNDIKIVNQSFFERLSALQIQDASLNALAILHNFANYVTFAIDDDMLQRIKLTFDAYLTDKKVQPAR